MQKVSSITRLVRWLCKQLNFDELLVAANILLEIINGKRDDIELRTNFHEEHPNYRQFVVDPLSPFTTPQLKKVLPEADFKQIIDEHYRLSGKDIKPVKRHKKSHVPPSYARCKHCNAPAKFLYVNDGRKKSQLRCKVCNTLFQSNCIRSAASQRDEKESKAKYWCPHCGRALYRWKSVDTHTIFKCGNKTCLCYLNNLEKFNEHEKKLQKTGMSSQFKLCYQYREYHFIPKTVLNYLQKASVLVWNFIQKYQGPMNDTQIAGDETYIRITDKWGYTWFVIGAQSKALWAFNISDNRGVLPALSTLTKVMENVPDSSNIEFIADGNPSYDAAVHAFNATSDNKSLSRIKVIGLSNDDDESKKYRHLKQLIERLNRTYKFHTRARCGFKNSNGAAVLTTLFVAYYNFLRPHTSLKCKPPINVSKLAGINTIQGKWLKMLEMAA